MMTLSTGTTSLDIIFCAVACIMVWRLATRGKRIPTGLRLPPGPPGKLIIGNITDLTGIKDNLWETADRWAKEYGDMVHINALGQHMIFLNSPSIAHDLFEKRSSIYSDRARVTILVDLMGWDWNIGMMEYGSWWRRHRRTSHQYFRPEAVATYRDLQTKLTRDFLRMLHDTPSDFMSHLRHLAGSIIMEIAYGLKLRPKDDPYVVLAEEGQVIAAASAVPGKYLVNILPFLKHIPEWMPGAGFQRVAREARPIYEKMVEMPFKTVKDEIEAGTARPSMLISMLEDLSHRPDAPADEMTVIRNVAGISYVAGADTSVSTLTTFMLAMLLHPEVQRKGQAELDKVLGNRLPVFEDRDSLPYVSAICKEVHRWHPTFPLGFWHRSMEDDVYGEYFIPAGSLVIGNAWTILHDEKLYGPNTKKFDPDRFFRPGVIDPIGHFGFGRRVCVGRYLADNTIFIMVASILKTFNILPARDENGKEIIPEGTYSTGLITHPDPFPCMITPRSEAARELLLNGTED